RDSPTSSPLPLSSSLTRPPPTSTLFPYTTLFRSLGEDVACPSMVPLDPPTITPAAGTFSQPTPVTLDHELADAALYYTISEVGQDRKSTRLNSSHVKISYAVFCLKKKKQKQREST